MGQNRFIVWMVNLVGWIAAGVVWSLVASGRVDFLPPLVGFVLAILFLSSEGGVGPRPKADGQEAL